MEPRRPGWPAVLGPLVVPAGVVLLRPVRLRDAQHWSRIRLRDREYLERWEPTQAGDWAERNAAWAWLSQWSTLRRLAKHGQCLPFAITVDGGFDVALVAGRISFLHDGHGALGCFFVPAFEVFISSGFR